MPIVLLALALVARAAMAAPNNSKFVDQGIPEIQITQAANDPDAFVIKNVARGKTIIGIGVTHDFQGKMFTTALDGVGSRVNVVPGETIDVTPGSVSVTNTREGVSGNFAGTLTRYAVAFVIFDDGTFYGTKEWHNDLKTKANYRAKFIQEAAASGNPEQFMREQAVILQSHEPNANSGMTSEERMARYDALVDWQAVNQVFDEKIDTFMKMHQERTTKFPRLKVARYLDSLRVIPNDTNDRFWAFNWVMNCSNGDPVYQGSRSILYSSSGSNNHGCSFPFPDPAPVPTGIVNFVTPLGTWSNFSAECVKDAPPPGQPNDPYPAPRGNYLHDGFFTLRMTPKSDPLLPFYAPTKNLHKHERKLWHCGTGTGPFLCQLFSWDR